MPIPTSRAALVSQLEQAFAKLMAELEGAVGKDDGAALAGLACADDWTIKDVLAVRRWWTEQVVRWTKAGLVGKSPITPKQGFRWSETPRLNAEIVANSQAQSWKQVLAGLKRGYANVTRLIDSLSDEQLLEVGVFGWADKWPIARWISINTTRQYVTARTMIRKVRKQLKQS